MSQNVFSANESAQSRDTQDQSFVLADGRQLGYAEYGVPSGRPVLFFHGAPSSRYIHADMADIAAQQAVRLIAVDRPGYGLSDPHPGGSMLSWAKDIAALTDKLGLARFAIIGFSAGSPYALACAYALSGRVSKLALVGAFAPLNVAGVMMNMSPTLSGLLALAQSDGIALRQALTPLGESPEILVAGMSATLPEWDKNVFDQRTAEFTTEYTQTLRSGIEGIAVDFELLAGDWGFSPDAIKTETYLWCGTDDRNTPSAMTDYFSVILTNSQTTLLPGEGHLSLYLHWKEILAKLK